MYRMFANEEAKNTQMLIGSMDCEKGAIWWK